MFQVYLTNIPARGLVAEVATLDEAIAIGKRTGFEFHVLHGGSVVGGYGIFSGWRSY